MYDLEDVNAGVGGVLDVLSDIDNKDAVDELVMFFIEKIEGEVTNRDSAITKGRLIEWQQIQTNMTDSQHTRGRQIISEIIMTTTDFNDTITHKFQMFRDDDEEDNR